MLSWGAACRTHDIRSYSYSVRLGRVPSCSKNVWCGEPAILRNELSARCNIGFDRNQDIINGFKEAGLKVDSDFFAFRSDTQFVCWQLILAGCGIGIFPTRTGEKHPDITKIKDLGDIGTLPIWLATHSSMQSNQRLRRVYDFLATGLGSSNFKSPQLEKSFRHHSLDEYFPKIQRCKWLNRQEAVKTLQIRSDLF